jgi:hypothetical protein
MNKFICSVFALSCVLSVFLTGNNVFAWSVDDDYVALRGYCTSGAAGAAYLGYDHPGVYYGTPTSGDITVDVYTTYVSCSNLGASTVSWPDITYNSVEVYNSRISTTNNIYAGGSMPSHTGISLTGPNKSGYKQTKLTLKKPSGGWKGGYHYITFVYDYHGDGNGALRRGSGLHINDFTNTPSAGTATPNPVGAGDSVTFSYKLSKTGTYAANTEIRYYWNGESGYNASNPRLTWIGVGDSATVSIPITMASTRVSSKNNDVCQGLYYSPKSATDSGWGYIETACTTVDRYTNDLTSSTATPTKVAAGDTVTFKHTLKKNTPSGAGGYARSPDVKYYTSGKDTGGNGSSASPLGTASVALGASKTVTRTYKTTTSDGGKQVCNKLVYSPVSSSSTGWGTNPSATQACADVYLPWEILPTTAVSGTTTKAGGVKVPTGSSVTFTHTVKNNGQKVVDDSDNPVKVKVTVYQYVRGGTETGIPTESAKRQILYEAKDLTSADATWTLLNNKSFTLNKADLQPGKTYCQFVRSDKSKRGSSNTVDSTPACVYIPCP